MKLRLELYDDMGLLRQSQKLADESQDIWLKSRRWIWPANIAFAFVILTILFGKPTWTREVFIVAQFTFIGIMFVGFVRSERRMNKAFKLLHEVKRRHLK